MTTAKDIQLKINKLEKRLHDINISVAKLRNYRFLIGTSAFVLFFSFSLTQWSQTRILIFLTLGMFFSYLVLKNRNWLTYQGKINNLKSFYLRTLQRKQGKFKENTNLQIELPSHLEALCLDLHVTGETSVLNLINETLTDSGAQRLLTNLIKPKLNSDEITKRQKLIGSLKPYYWQFVKLIALKDKKPIQLKNISMEIQRPLLSDKFPIFFGVHIFLFFVIWTSILFIILSSQSFNPIFIFTIYLFFSLLTRQQIASTFQRAHDLSNHLIKLKPIFGLIEKRKNHLIFNSNFPRSIEFQFSTKIKKIEKYISFLSVQGHPIVHAVLNSLCPWDYFFSFLTERWRKRIATFMPEIIDELNEFEVLTSQVIFYKYQTQTFSEIAKNHHIEFTGLYHPLISREKVVTNDFSKENLTQLVLITGSNMSGKSTFLRTFGVNHLLSMAGYPVFADKFITPLTSLRTCLKVHDSLEQGLSTFYYEVKQVSEMIKAAKNNENFIYLIDEIFRGTNNKERLIGSQAVIGELLKYANSGFISTHDLELTQLANNKTVMNYHFKDEVINNELVFNYKIQPGPCPTTNALKIIEKEGITIGNQV